MKFTHTLTLKGKGNLTVFVGISWLSFTKKKWILPEWRDW